MSRISAVEPPTATEARALLDGIQQVRRAGLDDARVVEFVANVALNVFTKCVNTMVDTEIDFPWCAPTSPGRRERTGAPAASAGASSLAEQS